MGWFDDIAGAIIGVPSFFIAEQTGIGGDAGDQTACIASANEQTAPLDAKIGQLSKTWKPTGIYTPDQMIQVVNQTLGLVSQATDLVNAAPSSTSDSSFGLANELDLLNQAAQQGTVFITSAAQARTQNINLNSPDLKTWVVNTMLRASNAMVAAYTFECALGPLGQALQAFESALDSLIEFLKTVVGEVAAVAEAGGRALLAVPGAVASLSKALFWGSIVTGLLVVTGGTFYVYRRYGTTIGERVRRKFDPAPLTGSRQRRLR